MMRRGNEPQLCEPLHPTDPGFARVFVDDAWVMERKYDGRRVLVRVTLDGTVQVTHARSGAVAVLPVPALRAVERYAPQLRDSILDAEVLRDGTCVLFDVPMFRGNLIAPFSDRRRTVTVLADALSLPWIAPQSATTEQGKTMLWQEIVARGWEGCVWKPLDAEYGSGTWFKSKVTDTVDAVVLERDATSCRLGLWDDSVGRLREVCGAAVKAKMNREIVAGVVVEVRYLYATDGALVQPRIVQVRHDKTKEQASRWSDVRLGAKEAF